MSEISEKILTMRQVSEAIEEAERLTREAGYDRELSILQMANHTRRLLIEMPEVTSERRFTLQEIENATEAAKGMVIDQVNDPCGAKILQMAGYIRRHLLETPEKKPEDTKLVFDVSGKVVMPKY